MSVQLYKKVIFTALLPVAAVGFVLLFAAEFLMIFVFLALISVGLLAVPLGIGSALGLLDGIVSDFTPVSLVLLGISALCLGLSLGIALLLVFTKPLKLLSRFGKAFSRAWR